jgi:hypothetical protein
MISLMKRYCASLTDMRKKTQPWLYANFDLDTIVPGSIRHYPDSMLESCVLSRVIYQDQPEQRASRSYMGPPRSCRMAIW